ncbi:hypothetical protein FHR96_001040 [Halomonas organivorans]|uniref:Uncharacterized protein n=1 Tax=Halomonas organivorans TaxID=257772 RepID=A0A7W5BXU7_9GAMM|nr:hypothetical protein [Halomonas organivorans]
MIIAIGRAWLDQLPSALDPGEAMKRSLERDP